MRTVLLALLLIAAPAAIAQSPPVPALAPDQIKPLFLFQYRPGPAWKQGEPLTRQGLAPHAAYISKLASEGVVVGGGPYADNSGGMAVIRAANEAAARAILAADPAITSGIFAADFREWTPYYNSPGALAQPKG